MELGGRANVILCLLTDFERNEKQSCEATVPQYFELQNKGFAPLGRLQAHKLHSTSDLDFYLLDM